MRVDLYLKYAIAVTIWVVSLPCLAFELTQEQRQQLEARLEFGITGGCQTSEPSGTSYFLFDGTKSLRHYLLNEQKLLRLARRIELKTVVSTCAIMDGALVFIDALDQVYQLDRQLDASSEPVWLAAAPPDLIRPLRFGVHGEQLYVKTRHGNSVILIESDVRNHKVRLVYPNEERAIPEVDPNLLTSTRAGFQLNRSYVEFAPTDSAGISVRRWRDNYLRLMINDQPMTLRVEGQVTAACVNQTELLVLLAGGIVQRYVINQQTSSVSAVGAFQLGSEVDRCVFGADRAYVVGQEPVIWVFSLAVSGLSLPRAATSDRMLQAISGLAVFESSSHELVLVQSKSDSAFLVFDASNMRLIDRFVIGVDAEQFIDGVFESGGFALYPSQAFPQGELIVHDARNRFTTAEQNLKIVPWVKIRAKTLQ